MSIILYSAAALAVGLGLVLRIALLNYLGERSDFTRWPRSEVSKHPDQVGIPGLREVIFSAPGQPRLAGWYVPSRNRAAVVLVHGTGADRAGDFHHQRRTRQKRATVYGAAARRCGSRRLYGAVDGRRGPSWGLLESHLPIYKRIKNMTLEEYLDSRIGLDSDNHQVRMLAGCAERDAPWSEDGRPISFPAVEARHLAMAKRNIEERFLAAGTLEQFAELTWYLKRVYGWPVHRCFHVKRRENSSRPRIDQVSMHTRRRLEQSNQFDTELYHWVNSRFAAQIAALQPEFGAQVRRFTRLNSIAQRASALRHRMRKLFASPSTLSNN